VVDVSRAGDAEQMVQVAVDRYGGLDHAFNNAGIEALPLPLAEVTEEEWDRVSAVNYKGVWLSMKYEIPAMLARGGGSIVNASSILGLVGAGGGAAYGSTPWEAWPRRARRPPRRRRPPRPDGRPLWRRSAR